jgi:uncharacterized protein YndB with AHSA1/START domain/predicted ester cyclase
MSVRTEKLETVSIERTYRATPDRVWEALTNRHALERWFFPLDNPGARIPVFDARVGGAYRIEFVGGPGAGQHTAVGIFKEVVPQRKLAFTWEWDGAPRMPHSLVTIELHPASGGTKVTLRHEGLPTAQEMAMHAVGWEGILDRYAALEDAHPGKATVRRFIEQGAAKNDPKVIDELVAPDFVWHNPMPGAPPTREGVKMAIAGFASAFPDYRLAVVDLLAEGDKVVSRIRFSGTNKGSLMGAPPTGKSVDIEFWHVERLRGGKIVERWNVMDNQAFMQQLGIGPAP